MRQRGDRQKAKDDFQLLLNQIDDPGSPNPAMSIILVIAGIFATTSTVTSIAIAVLVLLF